MTEIAKVLTTAEAEVLADCEETISHGLQTFVEVGTALSLIRDNRLYRADHATFEAYCQERWQLSRPRAYELMSAAEVVSGMPDTDRPANARQAVELARVPEEQRAEVWAAANEATAGKPTAAAIRAAAQGPEEVEPGTGGVVDSTSSTDHPDAGPGEAAAQLDADGLPPVVREADAAATADAGDGTGVLKGSSIPVPETAAEDDGISTSADASGEESPSVDSALPAAAPPPANSPAGGGVNPTDLVTQVLDALVPDENPHREWQRRFLSDIHAVHRLMRHDVDVVAAQADSQCIDEMGRVFAQLDEYRSKVLAALKAGLPDNVTPLRRSP